MEVGVLSRQFSGLLPRPTCFALGSPLSRNMVVMRRQGALQPQTQHRGRAVDGRAVRNSSLSSTVCKGPLTALLLGTLDTSVTPPSRK